MSCRWEDLEVGAAFRLKTPIGKFGGRFFKTGTNTYGLSPDEGLWEWFEGWQIIREENPPEAKEAA